MTTIRKPIDDFWVYLLKTYGPGIMFAVVLVFAVERVYGDFTAQTAAMLSLVREQSESSREVADALRELTEAIGKLERN